MKAAVWIDFACNDPDNGSFTGRVHMISYRLGTGDCVELEADNWNGYAFTDGHSWIRLHRRKFEYVGGKDWIGNWCWNGFKLERSEAKRLIGALRGSGSWRCTHGPCAWFDWFNREGRFAPKQGAQAA